MNDQERFEEGMCGQDIELFRQQQGLPTNRKRLPTRYHTDGIAFDDEYEDD
jgi:hypothetical protein